MGRGGKFARGFKGQRQKWFAFRFHGEDAEVDLAASTAGPKRPASSTSGASAKAGSAKPEPQRLATTA